MSAGRPGRMSHGGESEPIVREDLNVPTFDAVVFDMDGLLLDSERIALDTFLEACDHFQLGNQFDVFCRCIGTSRARSLEVIGEGFGERVHQEEFWSVWDVKYKASKAWEAIPLKAGVIPLLRRLSDARIPLAVATATRTDEAKVKLASVGLLDYFFTIIGGDQVVRGKPDPDIYLRAAEALGVDPARCLALEDSENGVKAATAAGMTVIQVPDLVQPSAELRRLGHAVHTSLEEVAREVFGV